MTSKKKPTFEQSYERIRNEAFDRFSTPEGCLRHFDCYEWELEQLHELVAEEKCRDIPRKQKDYTLASAVVDSGKLALHENLLKNKRKMYALHGARSVVCHAMESGHEGLIKTAKGLLSGIYMELSPVRDMDFGNTMMLRDVKVIEEVKASLDMIEGMSHAEREAARADSRPKGKKR
jgi:hypothetical protein